jgi:SAM-dependent methyltransferase
MFSELEKINQRPQPFQFYTATDLWADGHTSKKMLAYHLNTDIDVSSRRGEFIDRSVARIASQFGVTSATKIADFGCGPGLYTTRLARRGAEVTGIDFSKNSIDYARQVAATEQLSIHYLNQNYLDFETEDRFDLILLIMCDFCALSPAQRQQMLEKFCRLLQSNGAVLLDVYSLSAFDEREETASYEYNQLGGFWSPEKYYGFVNTFKYEREKVVLNKHTIVETNRTRTVYNWLQYFSPEAVQKEFEEAGLTLESSYTDVTGTPFDDSASEFAVVGRK